MHKKILHFKSGYGIIKQGLRVIYEVYNYKGYVIFMKNTKKKKYLFVDELKRIKLCGLAMSVCAVILVFAIASVSKLVFSRSAQRYLNKQVVETAANISSQISYEVSSQVNSWYAELEYAGSALLSHDSGTELGHPGANRLDIRLDDLANTAHSEFNEIGLILDKGEIYFSENKRKDISSRDYWIALSNGEHDECVESINDGDYAGNLLFAVRTSDKGKYINGEKIVGIAGLVSKERAVKILEADVFGENALYTILADYNGNVVVDTEIENRIENNVFEVYQHYMDDAALDKIKDDFKSGSSGIARMVDGDVPFYAYYSSISRGDNSNSLKNNTVDGWRILIMTKESSITQIISALFNESRVLLYVILAVFTAVLIAACLIERRNKLTECRLASIDSVTGVLNNKRFCSDANILLERDNRNYLLLAFNISQFRIINNELGHDRGDLVLRKIGETLQENLRNDELVTHSFADRFLLLVRSHGRSPVETAEDFRQRLSEVRYPDDVKIKFNAGVYVIRQDEKDISHAMDCARFAQAKTKDKSSNGIVVYSQEMFDKQREEYKFEKRAVEAIQKGYFTVYYQMKMDIQNNRWCGAEALVRWIDPVLGFISPGEFIPLFEKNGFVKILDKYVFEKVCSDIEGLIKSGEKCCPVSVNVSKKHLENEDFFTEYESILSRYDIPHDLIEFEITENMIVENEELLRRFIDRVHDLGCTCSLDDFGSGYSSFNMVKEFAFDTIKLDREFFYGSNGFDDSSKTIVESLIDLSHKLGKSVISEGIENKEQVDFLRSSKCDAIQGFYFSKPAPFEESLKKLND